MTNSSLHLFRASPADLLLARQAIEEIHERPVTDDAALSVFLGDPACYLILAVLDGRALGSLNGYSLRYPHRPHPQFLLYEIDVRPDHRRRGIGTALVEAFTAEARLAGASELWVVSNASTPEAVRMYERCGYRRPNPDDIMLERGLHLSPGT